VEAQQRPPPQLLAMETRDQQQREVPPLVEVPLVPQVLVAVPQGQVRPEALVARAPLAPDRAQAPAQPQPARQVAAA